MSRVKGVKGKHRWATAKGKVVGVRLDDFDYRVVEKRARDRGISIGKYLKWLIRVTRDDGEHLEVEE